MNRSIFKKEQEELKRKTQEEEEARLLAEFEESFQKSDKNSTMWIKGGTVNPEGKTGLDSSEAGSIYRPTAKFDQKKNDSTPAKQMSLMGMSKPRILKSNNKKPSNLEIFKEELKAIQEERMQKQAIRRRLRGEESPEEQSSNNRKSRFDTPPTNQSYPLTLNSNSSISNEFSLYGMLSDFDGAYDVDTDKTTTNLFLGNINPDVSEHQLSMFFARFGPLASVKIMWPRTEDEKSRGRNCGFVAFMCRQDGERALDRGRGRDVFGYEMKMGWGKPVPIPPQPVFIPPALMTLIRPPPFSGLPFNAQPASWLVSNAPNLTVQSTAKSKEVEKIPYCLGLMSTIEILDVLKDAVVKVVIPTERQTLQLINRMIEFVLKEGPDFEAAIMGRERQNPQFRFLFDYSCSEHTYYRWKMYSLLHGDSVSSWRTEEFRMYEEGPIWRPPPMNVFMSGMPEELIFDDGMPVNASNINLCATGFDFSLNSNSELLSPQRADLSDDYKSSEEKSRPEKKSRRSDKNDYSDPEQAYTDYDKETDYRKKDDSRRRKSPDRHSHHKSYHRGGEYGLSEKERDDLDLRLRGLEPKRASIGELMLWCLEHADSSSDIVDLLVDALSPLQTPLNAKLARLFLINDILRNCHARFPNASLYRRNLEKRLPEVFRDLYEYSHQLDSRMQAELLKNKVISCFQSWDESNIYSSDFIISLQNIFLGLVSNCNGNDKNASDSDENPSENVSNRNLINDDNADNDFDGKPLVDYDGDPLEFDIDGVPLEKDEISTSAFISNNNFHESYNNHESNELVGESINKSVDNTHFIPSKWETVDPEIVSSEAVTLATKWNLFAGPPYSNSQQNENLEMCSSDGNQIINSSDTTSIDGVEITDLTESSYSSKKSYKNSDVRSSTTLSSNTLNIDNMNSNDEMRRSKLREIELKVMKYQDELESIAKKDKLSPFCNPEEIFKEMTIYREKLLDKMRLEGDCLKQKEKHTISIPSNIQSKNLSGTSSRRSKKSRSRSSRSNSRKDSSSPRSRSSSSDRSRRDYRKSSHSHSDRQSRSNEKKIPKKSSPAIGHRNYQSSSSKGKRPKNY